MKLIEKFEKQKQDELDKLKKEYEDGVKKITQKYEEGDFDIVFKEPEPVKRPVKRIDVEELKRLFNEGKTPKEISVLFKSTKSYIEKKLVSLKLGVVKVEKPEPVQPEPEEPRHKVRIQK